MAHWLETVELNENVLVKWKIARSSLHHKVGIAIESPKFAQKWVLQFYPNGQNENEKGWFGVFVSNATTDVLKASFSIDFLQPDGAFKNVFSEQKEYVFKEGQLNWGVGKLINRDKALKKTDKDYIVFQVTVTTKNENQGVEPIRTISDDNSKLLAAGEFSDFKIISEEHVFNVHKCILSSRSEYFYTMFKNKFNETEEGAITITDFSKSAVEQLLSFIYSGKVTDSEVTMELAQAADKYLMSELKLICSNLLAKSLSKRNVCKRLSFSSNLKMPDLKEACLIFMMRNWTVIVKSSYFDWLLDNDRELAKEAILMQACLDS